MNCAGYEIICPDGLSRHYPYHNKGDADCDADQMSDAVDAQAMLAREKRRLAEAELAHKDALRRNLRSRAIKLRLRDIEICKWAMRRWSAIHRGEITLCDPFEDRDPPSPHGRCPGGKHTVRALAFEHDVPRQEMH